MLGRVFDVCFRWQGSSPEHCDCGCDCDCDFDTRGDAQQLVKSNNRREEKSKSEWAAESVCFREEGGKCMGMWMWRESVTKVDAAQMPIAGC